MLTPNQNNKSSFFSKSETSPVSSSKNAETPTLTSQPTSVTTQTSQQTTANDLQNKNENKLQQTETKTQKTEEDRIREIQERTAQLREQTKAIHEDLKNRGFQYSNPPEDKSQSTPELKFKNLLNSAKTDLRSLDPNKLSGMSESEASQYASQSISDMEQKMVEISNMSNTGNSAQTGAQTTQNTTSNTVSNNSQNITQITMDYLRNIRMESEKTPHWRSMLG